MATRGRKPVPAHLNLIRGNPGKRKLPDPEKAIPAKLEAPEYPEHLTGPAIDEWERMIGVLMELKLMSKMDMAGLASYCQAYGRWVTAENALAECAAADPKTGGLTIMDAHGIPKINPLVNIANKAMLDAVRFAAEFGMTPSARSRVTPSGPGKDENPFENFRKQA